jgi:signal transduction histidine kinase
VRGDLLRADEARLVRTDEDGAGPRIYGDGVSVPRTDRSRHDDPAAAYRGGDLSSRLLIAIAAVLGVAGFLEALLAPGAEDARVVGAIAAPLLAAPLAWGAGRLVAALAAVAVVLAAQAALGGTLAGASVTTIAVLAVALYCAGRHASGRWALAGAAVSAAAIAATRVAADPAARPLREALLTFAAVACPLLVGRWVRGQGQLQRELVERSARRERMRTRDARNAAEEERTRIAADLRLAVAGGLEHIAAEAAALRAELPTAKDAAQRLARIAATARTALADVRRVLGVLRHEGAERRLAPPAAPAPLAAAAVPATSEATAAPPTPAAVAAAAAPGARGAVPTRNAQVRPAVVDAVLAAAVVVVTGAELAISESLAVALTALPVAAPLLLRRRAPLATAGAVLAAIALQSALATPESFPLGDMLAMVAASYAIGAYATRRTAVTGALLLAAGVAAHAAIVYPDGVIAALLGGVLLPWTVGRVVQGSRDLTREGRRRSEEIELGRSHEARAAVTRERARVARELHDAVAHNISVIAIQAGGAEPLVGRDPERAAECLELIEQVAREALAELGRLGAGEPQDAPRPTLARVGVLAERARAAGIAVDLDVATADEPLPAGVDLAAFRVVQEALANTAKHAGAAHAHVVVRRGARALDLEIADDGRGPGGRPARDGGHGLAGMRERVALYGGTLETGPRERGRGFRVRATIPIDG